MDRKTALAAVLKHARLVTPSPVALRVVDVAGKPDCTTAEIVAALSKDPVLCGKVLKTVNSCVFGGGRQPVATVDRAVVLLGLNALRSLVLGLSLPVAQSKTDPNPAVREFWIDAVSGGILAKELSVHREGASPGYDLVAGLLRDLGRLLLAQHDPTGWERCQKSPVAELLTNPCGIEERAFGVHHVDVTCALLASWNLPDDVVEPIRYHHHLDALPPDARKSWRQRAELLNFVEALLRLDQVVESPALLKNLLARAMLMFGFGQQALIEFLHAVAPRIEEVKAIFDLGMTDTTDYSAVLTRGCEALVDLSFRSRFDILGGSRVRPGDGLDRTQDYTATRLVPIDATPPPPEPPLEQFRAAFLADFPPGGCQLDQFELRKELGRGAMGVVFAGFDPGVQRDVAVKVMSPEYASSNEARLRFTREARSLAAVHHPNVVGVYSLGTADGLPYMAMEFVHGGSLEELIDGIGPLPVAQVADLGGQIALGLAAAHAKGIVHRDLKPANVFVEAVSGRAKLGDFGLARGLDNLGLTQAGALVGSPLFMSPEQIDGLPLDGRSDLFSLGTVLYGMCTAKLPFEAMSMTALLRLIADATPIPPKAHRPDLPEWLNAVVIDLLKKNPDDRIPSADALYARLSNQG